MDHRRTHQGSLNTDPSAVVIFMFWDRSPTLSDVCREQPVIQTPLRASLSSNATPTCRLIAIVQTLLLNINEILPLHLFFPRSSARENRHTATQRFNVCLKFLI